MSDSLSYVSICEDAFPAYDREFLGHFLLTWLTLISAWMSDYMYYKVWDGYTYPFPKLIFVNG